MLAKEIRYTGSFEAVDKDGVVYKINMFTEILDVGTLSDPNAEIEGLKSLKTDNGHNVNYIKKGEYKIVGLETMLRSDDPKAP